VYIFFAIACTTIVYLPGAIRRYRIKVI